jgi:HAMP domain-containing protein
MRRGSESPGGWRPAIFLGLRARLLAALVFTAAATLAAAALALLAPLESQLRSNTLKLTEAQVSAIKSGLGGTALVANVRPNSPLRTYHARIDHFADGAGNTDHLGSLIVWWHVDGKVVPFDFTDVRRDRHASSALAIRAYNAGGNPVHEEAGGVLSVAARYRAPGTNTAHPNGIRYVLQVFRPVDYLGAANSVVRSAFVVAALVGLAVALLLGIALTSRLLRRLRLLQDASRNFDEKALGTLIVPHERFSDEIGGLANSFATMHARLRQQEDARRAFVATASHELRTPLASLDGMLELLADDLAAEPADVVDARERVASAQQQSRRLRGLASDLLDLSRLDAALDLRSEPVELGETARAVHGSQRPPRGGP